MVQAYVALGANLGDPQAQVRAAMRALDTLAQTRVTARSPLYLTPPWGVTAQPAFVNAVAGIETALSAHALLAALQTLESRAGRTRDGQRWGPRVLDLDLLLYEDAQYQDEQLAIPHPRLAERAFVLLPLADIAATLEIPGHGRVIDLLARVDTRGCQRLSPDRPSS
ncbi:MAG TPA: 2-amino-4-hydroxy-6-hydroxymethyldihydropteridine diphosphokinase [Rhodanobacteraceae bacterium]|nr:2-amino-4-hydroxy-6-hydroxymethyldihydropteridine diphosphokinase [Rhodanobacteraceae bacterium]